MLFLRLKRYEYICVCFISNTFVPNTRKKVKIKKKNLNLTYRLNPFPNKPFYLCVCSIILLKTLWEKKKLLVASNFAFSHSIFYLFGELSAIFINFRIIVCKLFQFESIKFVVWERVRILIVVTLNIHYIIPSFNH